MVARAQNLGLRSSLTAADASVLSAAHPTPSDRSYVGARFIPNFADRVVAAVARRGTPAVVGLDPQLDRIPAQFRERVTNRAAAAGALREFCNSVIEVVAPFVPAVKVNSAFFEAVGPAGVAAYFDVIANAHRHDLLTIGDVKRGDIGSTAAFYAAGHIGARRWPDADKAGIPDAVTLAGYLGENAVRPFIDAAIPRGAGLFVLVRPSDPGADEVHEFGGQTPFYMHMARLVRRWGNGRELIGECGLSVVGAVVAPKDAESTRALREALPAAIFLVPGYGAQGASAEKCRPCFLPDGSGALVNASRSVLFAFESAQHRARFGDDWKGCISAACKDFATDVSKLLEPNP
ncbi:MAG: orotidine-5'-phosphate decarboxylase [Phycisphaerae bacterium]